MSHCQSRTHERDERRRDSSLEETGVDPWSGRKSFKNCHSTIRTYRDKIDPRDGSRIGVKETDAWQTNERSLVKKIRALCTEAAYKDRHTRTWVHLGNEWEDLLGIRWKRKN